jgi:pimeloyl-ACP methyl ester carboxylesterase
VRTHLLLGPGDRPLHVHEAGARDGRPIVVHHGTPADGRLYGRWVRDAEARGIRLIGYDRPGYGGSGPAPERAVADAAADVAAIADALEIERFATWGISGGGPHALACAALLGDRVVAAASLGGIAPFDAHGLNPFAGMGRDNIVELGAAMQGRAAIEPIAREQAAALLDASGPEIVALMRTLVSPPDEPVLDGEFGEFWAAGMGEVFAQGVEGWVEDDLAFVEPFGFAVEAIGVPVLVWHGHHDRFVPVEHGRWLGARIPGAELRLAADDGHLTLIAARVPAVHDWLLARFGA